MVPNAALFEGSSDMTMKEYSPRRTPRRASEKILCELCPSISLRMTLSNVEEVRVVRLPFEGLRAVS